MPELPEVEVVKRSLENEIKSLTIKKIEIYDSKLRYRVRKQDLNKIIGLKLLKVQRRSKYLLFFFNKEIVMIVHLGMTGKFFIKKKNKIKKKTSFYYSIDDVNNKHDRVEFSLNKKIKLIYNDIRKFGFIKISQIKKINDCKHLKFLGLEPLSNKFNFKYFKRFLNG